MAAEGLAAVSISVTTLDEGLARKMEPRAPAPKRRLQMIRRLSEAGIPVRVQVSPLIPALTDHELEAVMEAGREAGARAANCIPLRLPLEVAGLFRDWLEATVPDRAARVMGRVRELHGGRTMTRNGASGCAARGSGPNSSTGGPTWRASGWASAKPTQTCGATSSPHRQGRATN
jgi:DNA repair photolyase